MTTNTAATTAANIDTISDSVQAGGNILVAGGFGYGKNAAACHAIDNVGMNPVFVELSALGVEDLELHLVGIPSQPQGTTETVYALGIYGLDSPHVVFFTGYDRAPVEVQDAITDFMETRTFNAYGMAHHFTNISSFIVSIDTIQVDDLSEEFLNLFAMVVEFD